MASPRRSPRGAAIATLALSLLAAATLAGALAPPRRAGRAARAAAAPEGAYTLEAEADRVDALPGAPGPQDFGMFAG
jgi:hypothetical protein